MLQRQGMKDILTMVIPTFNRNPYLNRAIEYYAGAPFKINIIDSSDNAYQAEFPENINYKHTSLGFPEKLFKAMEMVNTKYFVLCGDDDFVSFSGMEGCLSFLEQHGHYVAAQGRSIAFKNKNGVIKKSPLNPYARNLDVTAMNVESRIVQYTNIYVPLMYSVMRTEVVRDIFDAMHRYKIKEANLIEMGVALGLAIRGKLKILPLFYAAREKIAYSGGKTYKTIMDISKDKGSSAEYKRFKAMLAEMIVRSAKCELPEALLIVAKGLSIYLTDFYMLRKQIWSRRHRIIKILKSITSYKNIKELLLAPLTEIEDMDFFFDIVNEKGYPFRWDEQASNEWNDMAHLIRNHTNTINKTI